MEGDEKLHGEKSKEPRKSEDYHDQSKARDEKTKL